MDKKKIVSYIKIIGLAVIIIGIPIYILVWQHDWLTSLKSVDQLKLIISGHKYAPLYFLLLELLQIIVSFIPGEVFQFAAGYLFGPVKAILLTLTGCIAGSLICFFLARWLGRDFVRRIAGNEKAEKYIAFFNSEKAYLACFLLFLIPGIPKDILNYIAGITEIKATRFIILSNTARLPGIAGSVLVGSLLDEKQYMWAIVVLAFAIVVFTVCVIFRKRIFAVLEKLKKPGGN